MGLIRAYIFNNGIVGLSLSSLARGIASNNRMLLYHFGSLDNILESAVDEILDNGPLMRSIADHLRGDGPTHERLAIAWRQVSRPERLPYLRIFFARLGMASDRPDRYGAFLAHTGEQWVRMVEAAIVDDDRIANSTDTAVAIVSLWRGLQVQLISGGSAEVIDRVHDRAIAALVGR